MGVVASWRHPLNLLLNLEVKILTTLAMQTATFPTICFLLNQKKEKKLRRRHQEVRKGDATGRARDPYHLFAL